MSRETWDVLVIGAGAAGMMCAIEAGKRGRRVMLLDHAKVAGEKIRISGGGRCNFTNIHSGPGNFTGANPRFAISALKRYRPRDFISLVEQYNIPYFEKTLGQLFCERSARDLLAMLQEECEAARVDIRLQTPVDRVRRDEQGFMVQTSATDFHAASLVIATGGKSIPKMGATGFGYDIARQFGLDIVETRAGLAPLTFDEATRARMKPLSGIAVDAEVSYAKTRFREALLFTHRGLSGPSILQISSYWQEGTDIQVNLAPDTQVGAELKAMKVAGDRQQLANALQRWLPKRVAQHIAGELGTDRPLAELPDAALARAGDALNRWRVRPVGTEGYRTAEVTLGGVDTKAISSKTFECLNVPGLYFIGEVLDITGHLGGFNLQWAWASGHAAGQYV